jgi:uncharacterized membrane protein
MLICVKLCALMQPKIKKTQTTAIFNASYLFFMKIRVVEFSNGNVIWIIF